MHRRRGVAACAPWAPHQKGHAARAYAPAGTLYPQAHTPRHLRVQSSCVLSPICTIPRIARIVGQGQGWRPRFFRVALAGISLPAHPGVLAAPASMPAGAASRYALGDGGVGAARPAPAASLISASRYALGARRSAPRALRACVPGGAATGCHRRLALRARRRWRGRCAPGRLWQPGRRLALRARRRRHGRCAPGRLGRLHVHVIPPDNCARCLLVGMSKTSCASRCSKRSVQGALRAPAEGEGGEGWSRDHHARACGGTLVCCRSMCSASRRGAPLGSERLLPQARPIPRAFSARAAALRAPAVRTRRAACASRFSCPSRGSIMVSRAGSPLGEGVSRIMCPGDSLLKSPVRRRVSVWFWLRLHISVPLTCGGNRRAIV